MPPVHVALLKFSSARYNEAFIDKGAMRFNTLDYFRKIEKRAGRADPLEGLAGRKQIVRMELVNNSNGQKLTLSVDGEADGKLENARLDEWHVGNIFCMYGITTDWLENHSRIDARLNANDDPTVVIIQNVGKFRELVMKELTRRKLRAVFDFVKYSAIKPEFEGWTPFNKSLEFDYQHEYRLFFHRNFNRRLDIEIGSLREIASIHDASNLGEIDIRMGE